MLAYKKFGTAKGFSEVKSILWFERNQLLDVVYITTQTINFMR
jgi:hypothetical protein